MRVRRDEASAFSSALEMNVARESFLSKLTPEYSSETTDPVKKAKKARPEACISRYVISTLVIIRERGARKNITGKKMNH
jgi:hypothetical protein